MKTRFDKANAQKVGRLLLLASSLIAVAVFPVSANTAYKEIEWTELMPAEDLAALLNPPSYLDSVQDGSQQDSVDAFSNQEFQDDRARAFQDALTSLNVVADFDGKGIKIPGYIVPLQQNADKEVTEFFIVPYFGACLHMPPPPPNQIIYAKYPDGIELESLYTAFWFTGTVKIQTIDNALGTSAYSMTLDTIDTYEE